MKKTLDIEIDLPTAPGWGVVMVMLGLGYHAWMSRLATTERNEILKGDAEEKKRIRAHDAPIFQRFLVVEPEHKIKNSIRHIGDDHSYTTVHDNIIDNVLHFLNMTGNAFNDDIVQEQATVLRKCLIDLTTFMGQHFFTFGQPLPDNVYRYAMEPHWNFDRGGNPTPEEYSRYSELATTLVSKTRGTLIAYDGLVRSGNKRLL